MNPLVIGTLRRGVLRELCNVAAPRGVAEGHFDGREAPIEDLVVTNYGMPSAHAPCTENRFGNRHTTLYLFLAPR